MSEREPCGSRWTAPGAVREEDQVRLAGAGDRPVVVRADSLVGRRISNRTAGFQASADVTPLVRRRGPGTYTLTRTAAGPARASAAMGGWALVVVYEHPK